MIAHSGSNHHEGVSAFVVVQQEGAEPDCFVLLAELGLFGN